MAEEKVVPEEDPTMPEEKPEEKETPKTEVDELVAELEKLGITDSTQLQGMDRASKEAGNLANIVGDLRAEVADLKQVKTKPPQETEYLEPEGGDLRSIIRDELRGVQKETAEASTKARNIMLGQYKQIKGDPYYPQVKEIWNEKLKDPEFVFDLQSGETDPLREYDKVVREYLVGIAKRSVDTIKTLQGGGKPAAPHLETGARIPGAPELKDDDKRRGKVKETREKVDKGKILDLDEEIDLLDAVLGPE